MSEIDQHRFQPSIFYPRLCLYCEGRIDDPQHVEEEDDDE